MIFAAGVWFDPWCHDQFVKKDSEGGWVEDRATTVLNQCAQQ